MEVPVKVVILLSALALALGKECLVPKDSGPCLDYTPRYYYNENNRACEQFIYGGCDGNENNFKSLEECLKRCGCEENKYYTCGSFNPLTCRNYKNPPKDKSGKCIPGCHCLPGLLLSDDGRCVTEQECKAENQRICNLQKDSGPCLEFNPRYYYNANTGACEKFTFGGCYGNENNFKSMEECEAACGVNNDECSLPSDAGPCITFTPRYFYNMKTRRCEMFIYGGCGGNGNNFKTLEACMKICGKTAPQNKQRSS